ncbi:hypothetical protein [Paenibacillus eucommiae]|uniref:Uncharacterized protein n=1 Tax=Paenibacillus eucommiae TaxID=1355755 RepID=A0ABS4J2P2_9BACL|nr:hypothetical protein [Paenibacillus eucommiae]MBP1994092.1 hypothetical protein [Paenibacillus eucommiae]
MKFIVKVAGPSQLRVLQPQRLGPGEISSNQEKKTLLAVRLSVLLVRF